MSKNIFILNLFEYHGLLLLCMLFHRHNLCRGAIYTGIKVIYIYMFYCVPRVGAVGTMGSLSGLKLDNPG
jgi:hypothetical protein